MSGTECSGVTGQPKAQERHEVNAPHATGERGEEDQ
jgi:hypothetical protein